MTDYLGHPLDSCFERLKRADEHLLDFNSRVETMLMKQAYAVGIKLDENPPHCVMEVTLPPGEKRRTGVMASAAARSMASTPLF
jgi:hypothetical protein